MKREFLTYLSLSLFLIALFQIEEIWRSLQNQWVYGLPFGLSTSNYWLAHDIWYLVLAVSWCILIGLLKHQELTVHVDSNAWIEGFISGCGACLILTVVFLWVLVRV